MADTVDELVRFHSVHDEAKPMVIDLGRRLSYRELDVTTHDLAMAFINAGVVKGTRVGLIMPNGVGWVQIAIALTARRQGWPADRLPDVSAAETNRSIVDALAATVTPSDAMVIMFTSGSSGAPKGVVHSHGSALGAARSGLASRCIDSETRLYLPMPFFWVGGFGSGVLSALVAGATLITEEIPQPDTTLRLLERERVTLFRGWPDQAEAVARHPYRAQADLSALRSGSLEALLPAPQSGPPRARGTLFGMTEAFGPYCGYPADTDMPRSAWSSCGKPFPGMEIRITDPGDGQTVAVGTVGMIQIRGPH